MADEWSPAVLCMAFLGILALGAVVWSAVRIARIVREWAGVRGCERELRRLEQDLLDSADTGVPAKEEGDPRGKGGAGTGA